MRLNKPSNASKWLKLGPPLVLQIRPLTRTPRWKAVIMPEDAEFIRRRNGEIEPLVRKCAILPQTVKLQQFGALGACRRCPLLLENLMNHG